MNDLTPLEQAAENTDRMIAAMMTFTADAMEPDSDVVLIAFCNTIEPAEA
jgi:hypothetical protein